MTETQAGLAEPRARRRALVLLVAAALLLVLLALLAGGGWWWNHPHALPSAYGASVETDARPYRPGVVWRAELTVPGQFPEEGALTLRSVGVGLDEGEETDATVEVLRCRPVRTDDGGFLSVGFGDERPAAGHGCVPVVDGTRMGPDDQLVAVLTPAGPGTYVLTSATVRYRLGASGLWRRGEETTRLHAASTWS